jgi:GMP synthase PP-ATPase subunit
VESAMMNKRKSKDVMKLLISDYEVKIIDENKNDQFLIKLKGPENSAYEAVNIYNSFYR